MKIQGYALQLDYMRRKQGQVLLLVVLLSATLFAIAGAVFFESIVQTQVTKIQEESIRALKAAEGLAEQALKTGSTVTLTGQDISLPGAEGQAQVSNATTNVFTTPLIQKDEQYTFYLADYNPETSSFEGDPQQPSFKIEPSETNFCDTNPFAVELTYVNVDTNDFERTVGGCNNYTSIQKDFDFGNIVSPTNSYHLLIIRVLADNTDFPGVRLKLTKQDGNWPVQGTTVVSTVQTASGVKKTVRVFQSYPQLPASFFVTRF